MCKEGDKRGWIGEARGREELGGGVLVKRRWRVDKQAVAQTAVKKAGEEIAARENKSKQSRSTSSNKDNVQKSRLAAAGAEAVRAKGVLTRCKVVQGGVTGEGDQKRRRRKVMMERKR